MDIIHSLLYAFAREFSRMTELPSPTDVLFVRAPSCDSKAIEDGSGACDDSGSSIHEKCQKIIVKKKKKIYDMELLKEVDETVKENRICLREVVLTYLNKQRESDGMSQYVSAGKTTLVPFWIDNSWWIHTNFQVRPKDDPTAKPELFFAEIKNLINGKQSNEVTKMCVLQPTDTGLNGCKACTNTHHPKAGGFRVGQRMYTIDPRVPIKSVKKSKEEQHEWDIKWKRIARLCEESRLKHQKELELKAEEQRKQSVAARTRSRTRELSVAARTRSRARELSVRSTSNN